ncbi:class I SAM-dependent methyltransferase [Lysinibacillus piscis]|uniref:Methyltransferase n=1 Tax=Lysinibacillus piscis TaxID=2518931 RepID=A0ABQ5NNQ0_9BACI|nr:class I SAM-dependent methyltransferase [Lysinibacillus sp. KH24]GLC90016.1 methyltransferase [Lysinibacillus sp. KH24]
MNERQFDKLLHIDTIGEQYGFPKLAHYHRYEPTPYTGLQQLFKDYEMPDNAVFIDMGCGKGRVPIYINYQFHIPTIGVEMDAGFYMEAEHNKKRYLQKHNSYAPITFIHAIAEAYTIKPSDNVFFFFNPFSIHIFRTVVHMIWQSYEKHMREIHIILYYPSADYLQFLHQDTPFQLVHEVHLESETNVNERLCVFALMQ